MRNFNLLFIAVLMFASCTGEQNKYEKTIANFVQTDKKGTWYDLKFDVVEMNEQGKVTVADSISFLTEEFRKDQQLIVKRIELAKSMTERLLSKEKSETAIDEYNANIVVMNNRIDSLNNVLPNNLNGYENRKKEDVLAVIVRCKYSIFPPSINTRVEETFDFYLSPSGDKCFGKKGIN